VAALAQWCFRHRTIVVLAWIEGLVTLLAVEGSVGSAYSTSFTLPGVESTKALRLLTSALPKQAGDSATIVWHVNDGTVRDQATQKRINAMPAKVAAAPPVAIVRSP
jgi:RND superfamily putative drug exporter